MVGHVAPISHFAAFTTTPFRQGREARSAAMSAALRHGRRDLDTGNIRRFGGGLGVFRLADRRRAFGTKGTTEPKDKDQGGQTCAARAADDAPNAGTAAAAL